MMDLFTREDWRLFTSFSTLPQKAGVAREDLDRVVLKELVDNALDAGDRCGLLEDWEGFVDVRSYGKGMSRETIERVYSVNRPLVSSKLLRKPTRGALGNGLRVVSGAVISTNGELYVTSRGKVYEVLWNDDGIAYTRFIEDEFDEDLTSVRIRLGHWKDGFDESWLDWSYYTLLMADTETSKAFVGKTHALWYDSESFYTLCQSFEGSMLDLMTKFRGITKATLLEFFDLDELGVFTKELSLNQADAVLSMLRKLNGKEVKSVGLAGADVFKYRYDFEDMGYCDYVYGKSQFTLSIDSFMGKHCAELPVTLEVWVSASDDKSLSSDVLLYVNKTYVTGDVSVVDKKEGTWFNLGGSKYWTEVKVKGPLSVRINIQTPYMPIKSDGKAPDFGQFMSPLHDLLLKVSRKAKRLVDVKKKTVLGTMKDVMLESMEGAIDKASGGGEYLFSQRQLFYAVRPRVIEDFGKEPDYNYFCSVLTEYEDAFGRVEGLYRDPRGVLYHPHTGEEIPIGTLSVNEYERPEWTFNKILYSEKEGFFTILKKAKFPERFDCALLTSKGYASRAVKDLFDLLGDTDEEIHFFCIHDADSAGTKIYETLSEATRSHKGTKVSVTNFGLDPWEALEMGLEVEEIKTGSNRKRAVASYVDRVSDIGPRDFSYDECTWEKWLQSYRVELNAMTTPQFLEWLEGKMELYGVGKVVPNEQVLVSHMERTREEMIREHVLQELLVNVGFEDIVTKALDDVSDISTLGDVVELVRDRLDEDLSSHWSDVVNRLVKERL